MGSTNRRAWAITGIAVVLILGIVSMPVFAHHSFAMYDTSVEKTMTGKLIRYVLGANHSQYVLQVVNPDGSLAVTEKGEPLIWNVETTAAAQLASRGITVETFKIGTNLVIWVSVPRAAVWFRRGY